MSDTSLTPALVRSGSRRHSFLEAVVEAIPEDVAEERGKSLGTKSIDFKYSFMFVINQIYGPGVLAIPLVYTQSGLFPTIFMVTFFLIVSSLASTCLAQAIASIPDNRQYQQRVEFGTAVAYYYGPRWSFFFQIALNITVQAFNIASVVICAQSLDQALITLAGSTYALELGPHAGFKSFDDIDTLYSSAQVAITLGYAIITAFFLPAGFLNLNDNVKTVQVGSFIFLVVLLGEFVGFFFWRGGNDGYYSLPAFGHSFQQLVSVFIFSWAYVIFIPSWLNEKQVDVSVNKVIWSTGIASWFGYLAIGILCAAVFSTTEIGQDDMLVTLSKKGMPAITRVTAHLFSLGVIAPGIPVCSVTTRYNLFVGGICGKKQSYFWGCVAPWMVAFIFCQGPLFAQLLNWTSLIFNGFVNFLVPLLMYMTSLRLAQSGGIPDWEAKKLALAAAQSGNIGDGGDEASLQGVSVNVVYNERGESVPVAGSRGEGMSLAEARRAAEAAEEAREKEELARQYAKGSGTHGSLQAPLLAVTPPARDSLVRSSSGDSFDPGSPSALHPSHGQQLREALPRSASREGEAVRFCSPVSSDDLVHGPVYPFPSMLRPYAYQIALALLVVTMVITIVQTAVDIYFTAKGESPLT